MNTNKEVEWRRFIVPKKVEHINDHLLIIVPKQVEHSMQDIICSIVTHLCKTICILLLLGYMTSIIGLRRLSQLSLTTGILIIALSYPI